MVFWCTYPDSILNRNNLGYSSACPNGTLAYPSDIPRLYFARYSYYYYYLGMAWKNVASFFHTAEHPRRSIRIDSRRRRQPTETDVDPNHEKVAGRGPVPRRTQVGADLSWQKDRT